RIQQSRISCPLDRSHPRTRPAHKPTTIYNNINSRLYPSSASGPGRGPTKAAAAEEPLWRFAFGCDKRHRAKRDAPTMMPRPQYAMALAAACLGVLARCGDASPTSGHRKLQTSVGTDLGCFRDSRRDRVLSSPLKGRSNMTPSVCAAYCLSYGTYQYYATQYGQECWCGAAGTEYDRLGALDMSECAYPCTGDASLDCGGFDSFQAYDIGTLVQSEGYLGCYGDTRASRVFAAPMISTNDNTIEGCKASCSTGEYAFYGLQYGRDSLFDGYAKYFRAFFVCALCLSDGPSLVRPYSALPAVSSAMCEKHRTTAKPSCTHKGSSRIRSYFTDLTGSRFALGRSPPVLPPTNHLSNIFVSTMGRHVRCLKRRCFCGLADEDYTVYGASNGCNYPCSGDELSLCGGYNAMDIYTLDTTTVTPAPVTPAPATVAPVTSVLVDLVPCLFSDAAVAETNDPAIYVMSLFFKGYWAPKTEEFTVSTTDDLTALLVDSTDSTPHGKCNAVYVGYAPSDDQAAALTAYSAQFKVRIVYFPSALTHSTESFTTKLGIQTWFADPIQYPSFIQLSGKSQRLLQVGASKVSITQPSLQTDPNIYDPALFSYPVLLLNGVDVPEVEVLADYADDDGIPIIAGFSSDQENAAMLSYTGADGHEELHIFFTIGWFDDGAWPWAHYFNEWATKGIFMGERRFYLGAVVDDLFLATPEFEYDGALNEAEESQRCTGSDLSSLLSVQDSLNTQYPGSSIITEFAFNGGGIAEKVSQTVDDIAYVPDYEETSVTTKGTKWFENDQATVHDINWLATNVPLMQDDMADGTWEDNDELLAAVISYLDTPSTFYHGHHTLIHLSRDQLRESDCVTEDTGNVQIALMTGMWDSDNYNWRSMVSPGITGLFNENCLESAAANLMTCYPGDNTFDGTVDDTAILINEDNQFHSIYTTVSTNGYDGAQIVPRFATYVYFNCVSGDCLVKENEYIRRFVCECTPLDPTIDEYVCTSTADECVDDDGNTEIQSFGSTEALFEREAATTTRYMLTGRRDKYMFHQANIIPAGDVGDGTQSLLDYWYEQVMAKFSSSVTFPVKTIKFDDLCTDFQLHEALDASDPYVTMALDAAGEVTGLTYVSGSGAGLVPLTVPTASADSIPVTGLSVQDTETYGTDTTYYLKDDDAATAVRVGTKPDAG
ncbi:unnamed protein product, partial [Scytosiphon promiscuus]